MENQNQYSEKIQDPDVFDIIQTRRLDIDQAVALSAKYFNQEEKEKSEYIATLEEDIDKQTDYIHKRELQRELDREQKELVRIKYINRSAAFDFKAALEAYKFWQSELDAMSNRVDEVNVEGQHELKHDDIRTTMEHNVRLLHVAAYQTCDHVILKQSIESGSILVEDAEIIVEGYVRSALKELSNYFMAEYKKPLATLTAADVNANDLDKFNKATYYIAILNNGLPGLLKFVEEWKDTLIPVTGKPDNLETIADKIRSEIVT